MVEQRTFNSSVVRSSRTRPTATPFEVFLDEDGLLHRLTQTVEVPASPTTNGQVLIVTTTLELYEFGLDMVVPGPPAAVPTPTAAG